MDGSGRRRLACADPLTHICLGLSLHPRQCRGLRGPPQLHALNLFRLNWNLKISKYVSAVASYISIRT